jgi:hypothetical protein
MNINISCLAEYIHKARISNSSGLKLKNKSTIGTDI